MLCVIHNSDDLLSRSHIPLVHFKVFEGATQQPDLQYLALQQQQQQQH